MMPCYKSFATGFSSAVGLMWYFQRYIVSNHVNDMPLSSINNKHINSLSVKFTNDAPFKTYYFRNKAQFDVDEIKIIFKKDDP